MSLLPNVDGFSMVKMLTLEHLGTAISLHIPSLLTLTAIHGKVALSSDVVFQKCP